MNPPKSVIDFIHKIIANFFWSGTGEGKGKHWVAWDTLCLPQEEEGIGFRSLRHMVDALFAKLWWNFRTSTTSLWSNYMWNKYCKRLHPVIAKGIGASHVWRKMTQVRELIEHNIWWQIKARKVNFWFDNWTKLGALYYIEPLNNSEEEIEVKELINNGEWNRQMLEEYLSDQELVEHICADIKPPRPEAIRDIPW